MAGRAAAMRGGPPRAFMKCLLASALCYGQNAIVLQSRETAQVAFQSRCHLAVSRHRSMTTSRVTVGPAQRVVRQAARSPSPSTSISLGQVHAGHPLCGVLGKQDEQGAALLSRLPHAPSASLETGLRGIEVKKREIGPPLSGHLSSSPGKPNMRWIKQCKRSTELEFTTMSQ